MTMTDSLLDQRLLAALAPKRSKILVAEDDPISARVIRAFLEQLNYEPLMACNGQEAWELFDREPTRLVISDWMMPEVDGLQLCTRIRKRAKTLYTYFVLLTANHTSAENFALATDAGVDDFLTKPLHREATRMRLAVAERILKFTAEIRHLKEMIPMCIYCRRIRDEEDYWERVETYIQKETGSRFSHGACPDCSGREMASLQNGEAIGLTNEHEPAAQASII